MDEKQRQVAGRRKQAEIPDFRGRTPASDVQKHIYTFRTFLVIL